MKKLAPLCSVFLLLTIFLSSFSPALACGPSFVTPVFAFESRPDAQLEPFARGELGVVQPGYNNTFLVAAYRYFNNAPPSAAEQKDLVSVWKAELYREDENEANTDKAVRLWLDARKKVLGDVEEQKIYTTTTYNNSYTFFPNCTANAFETAAKTLDNRIAAHGASDENVKNWVRTQDAVFTICSEGKTIPAEADASAPAWLKNDREYQIAAAYFYAQNFDEAKARFEKISANRESVWQPTANYLVARTLIREASLIEDDDEAKRKEKQRPLYEQAETRLQNILSDPSQKQFNSAAAKLLNLVKYRLHPSERIHELAAILSTNAPNDNLRQDLIDYDWLVEKQQLSAETLANDREMENAKKEGREMRYNSKPTLAEYPAQMIEDDLTAWILTFNTEPAAGYQNAVTKWKETNSPAWFVAAISKARKDSKETQQLISEADKIQRNSPAFATVAFHQARLLMEMGLRGEARQKLDSILGDRNLRLPVSAQNAFKGQRMLLAQNMDEFLQFAQRRAAAFAFDDSPYEVINYDDPQTNTKDDPVAAWNKRMMFDTDAARVFNEQMPLDLLKQAAVNQKLPDYLRRNLLIAAWTRAVVLERDDVAAEIAPNLAQTAPEFQPVLASYIAAKTPLERRNSATYALLKTPAFRPVAETGYGRINPIAEIDSYRDNWWCAPSDEFYDENTGQKATRPAMSAPSFLTPEQLEKARQEREKIKSLGGGSTYLARRAVDFATKTPADARLAESLHLSVRATRYGCQDCQTGTYSKQAHDLLKKRFPRSEWTKKTPYWFKDESCETQSNQ